MPEGAAGEASKRALELAGLVLAPAGVLTGVLYYFGYVRQQAFFAYFGVDLGSVGLSTSDYLVRSAGPLFVPTASLLLLGLGAVVLHLLVSNSLRGVSTRALRVVWCIVGIVALALLTFGIVGLSRRGDPLLNPLAAPLALGAGAILLDYGSQTSRLGGLGHEAWRDALESTRLLRTSLTVALVLVATFWGTANVALQHGLRTARAVELSLPVQPQAVVYSRDRLQITGAGVGVTELAASRTAYAFRYNGLRVLAHTGGHWLLVPVGWKHDNNQTVILLSDATDTIRVDLAP
jgi:hypothetical protein